MRGFVVCFLFLPLVSLSFFSFSVTPVSADPLSRVPGVKVGDKFTYGGFLALFDSDVSGAVVPQNLVDVNNTLSVVNTVTNVNGSSLSFEARTSYRNGTVLVEESTIDVILGNNAGNATFVAAGLSAGDRIYTNGSLASSRINSTSLGDFAGLMRETNLFNSTRVFPDENWAVWTEVYWDKITGVLVKQFWSYAQLTNNKLLTEGSIEYKMVDNNAWLKMPDTVAPIAKAGSDRTTAETGVPVVFDASDSSDDVGIAAVLWNFGDGDSASGLQVSHVYDEAGVYNVTLTVRDAGGNVALDYVTVSVRAGAAVSVFGLPLSVFLGLVALVSVLVLAVAVWRVWLGRPSGHKAKRRRK